MKRWMCAMMILLLGGCVTSGKYEKLQSKYDGAQDALEKRNASLKEKDAALDVSKKHATDLEQALADAQEKNQDLQKLLAQQHADLAEMVKDKSKLQASVQDMTQALADLQARKAQAEARIAEFKELLSKFKSLIDAGKLKVKIVDGRMVVQMATDVLFASGSARLRKDGKAAIVQVTQLLASIPKRSFQVEGFTDDVPISTTVYPSNWELAAARALSVVKTMISAGMPAERVSAASYGETRPAASNDTPEGRAQNRRIEIAIVPDLSALPGFDELQKVESGGAPESSGAEMPAASDPG